MRYITQYLPQLKELNLSSCWKLTDAGLAQLGLKESTTAESLVSLDISNCKAISNSGILHLRGCANLVRIDATNTKVKADGLNKFVQTSQNKLKVYGGSIVDRKSSSTR